MKSFERVILNAAIFFGWTFFSALSASAMLYGVFEFQRSIVAALIAAGLAFFTMMRRSDFGNGNGNGKRHNPGPRNHDGGEERGDRRDRLGMVV